MKKRLSLLLTMIFLLCGCTGRSSPLPEYAPSEGNRLTIYTSHKEEIYMPLIQEFEARTGIWVEVVPGGTNELLQKIASEQDSPVADVMFGGGVESLQSYRHCFTPYISTESDAIRSSFFSDDAFWTPFSVNPVVLVYNTNLVNPAQITDWDSLESPAFRGRIAFADPAVSGSSFTALVTRILADGSRSSLSLKQLAENLDGHMLGSSGDVLTAVSDGDCLVGISLEETALKRIAADENLAMVYPASGTSCVPDASALVKNAPHSDNAKKFLDFTISYEVQQMLADRFYRRPVRTDIPTGPYLQPLRQLALIDYDVLWASQNRDTILSDWSFFMKEAE